MTDILAFTAARMTDQIVGRDQELKELEMAVCQPGDDTRVVIVEGDGGLGKTRLLNEVLWRVGHPKAFPNKVSLPALKWQGHDQVIISDLLDFADVRLHTANDFLEALRNGFTWRSDIDFPDYDSDVSDYQSKLANQADYFTVQKAAQKLVDSFLKNHRQITQSYRLVWALDTAEQLSYVGADWLLEQKLLTPDDMSFSTQQQILDWLQNGQLPNTTIILVGRPNAKLYFEQLRAKAQQPNSKFTVQTISLNPLTEDGVKNYLAELARSYQSQPQAQEETAVYLNDLAKDADRAKVLHLYTGGQPVRLALFVDILVEGKQEPEALQDPFDQAKIRTAWNNQTNQPNQETLGRIREEIEGEFINLIFTKTSDLRSQILIALVRAKHSLDAERLAYLLDNSPHAKLSDWKENQVLRQNIEEEINPNNAHSLSRLSFVKRGSGNSLILQDELYDIYNKHMARKPQTKEDETIARQNLFRQMLAFVEHKIDELKAIQTQNREDDEKSLHWVSPARALTMKYGYISDAEQQNRVKLSQQIIEAQLEKLHYELRINPDDGFNDVYTDLAEEVWRANNISADVQVQIVLWQLLQSPYEQLFIELPSRKSMFQDNTPWQSLERVAAQETVMRWIKRFFLRNEYRRAIEFAEATELQLKTLPESLQNTMNHTFSKSERVCWREMARIYLGQDIPGAITHLHAAARQMERLLTPEGIPERQEFGFTPDYPGYIRLRRVLGVIYNHIGYGYVTQGKYRQAVTAYAQSRRNLQGTGFDAQRGYVINNLARALSEIGNKDRAIRVCWEGLELRQKLGAEGPIAYSYNTFALIYNNNYEANSAWLAATQALIYFRKLDNPRGVGLSLLQLSEALRRLAFTQQLQPDSPEELLKTAHQACQEAVEIFSRGSEKMRYIEAEIEMGCIFRDQMRYNKESQFVSNEKPWPKILNKAIGYLQNAVSQSENEFPRHKLDAQVNLAWTYYYATDFEHAEDIIKQILDSLTDKPFLLNKAREPILPKDIDETETLVQLSKLWTLKMQIAMGRFAPSLQLTKVARKKEVSQISPEAKAHLQAAAEAFVLSLGHAQLFSTSSINITLTFDHIYRYLKKFETTEMTTFYQYVQEVSQAYQIAQIKAENPANIAEFLIQSFGDFFPTSAD